MALSNILRRSASRVMNNGGNGFYANLILPCASVPSLRQFSSSPSLSSKDNESVVGDAKKPSLDESLVNHLILQVQSLQKDIDSLRKSYGKPVSEVEEEAEPIHNGVDEKSSLKVKAIDEGEDSESDKSDEVSSDEGKDFESDKSDEDINDEGKDSESESDKSDEDSNDEGKDSESDEDNNDEVKDSESDKSDEDSNDEGKDSESDKSVEDNNDEVKDSESDVDSFSNDEALSETDENNDHESDDNLVPKSKENEELLKGIRQEMERAQKFIALSAPDSTIPVDFPFYFEEDYCGDGSTVLSLVYEDQFVEVRVENPTVYTERPNDDYNTIKSCPFSMNLTVSVTANVKQLELKCGANREEISIYTVKDAADGVDHKGVYMSELNENLKGEFGKYLEARGITLSTTNFLYKHMLRKANRERLRVLQNIEKMVA